MSKDNIVEEVDKKIKEVMEKKTKKNKEELARKAYEEYKASGKKISLDELAKKYGLSKATLARRFKKYEEEELKKTQPPGIEVEESEEEDKLTLEKIVSMAATHHDTKTKKEFERKLAKFLSMPKEERDRLVIKSLEYFIKLLEYNREEAVRKFITWMSTPDGIIIMSYIWRPRFREKAMRAISEIMLMAYRVG